jgi:hypothetical protein
VAVDIFPLPSSNALNLMPNSIMSKGMSWGELRCRCTSIANMAPVAEIMRRLVAETEAALSRAENFR